jgi:predicted O-methyltransferase YrrM
MEFPRRTSTVPQRYQQLLDAVWDRKPESILEIGTWNGQRAFEMLSLVPNAEYYGFDLFEEATADTDAEEMNVKQHYSLEDVKRKLNGFNVYLFQGNTRDTLKDFSMPVDLIWMDGGHSIETIESDWRNIQRCIHKDTIVLLDDYYTGAIDTTKFGCNQLVETLNHEVLPISDRVVPHGRVQMVRVYV